jgi:hypothetical protein
MKTLKSILFTAIGVCLFAACNKNEQTFIPGGNEFQNDAFICGKVFKVRPTNGKDITADLKRAFDNATAAGPGSVVQLPAGEYELGFIEIREFYGSFTGAGKGKTIITVKTGLDCDALTNQNLYGWLISFVGGDINMSDMTLKYPKETLVCEEGYGLTALVMFADYNAIYTSKNKYIKASVNNVEFIGDKLGPWDYNCWNALAAGNDDMSPGITHSHVDLKITNCIFDSFGWGMQMIGIKEGKFTLGTKNNGNTFTNCAESAVFYSNINVSFELIGNKFNIPLYSWGLEMDNSPNFFVDEPQTKRPLYTIEGNEFNMVGSNGGIFMHDHRLVTNPDENLPVLFQVIDNQFNMSNDQATGTDVGTGIGMYEVKGLLLRDNKFTGTGEYGIWVSPLVEVATYAENGLILLNNFSNTTFVQATILLDVLTKNWNVIGKGLSNETIINLGTNNVIKEIKKKIQDKPFIIPHRQFFNERHDDLRRIHKD